jgi:hypothetical protein
MYKYFTEMMTESVFNNNVDMQRQATAFCGEHLVKRFTNGNIRHIEGYDVLSGDGKRYEVKSTKREDAKAMKVGNLFSKHNACDFIALVDFQNKKLSLIPHDVFFDDELVKLGKGAHGRGRFAWSASYNESDKISVKNTLVFKQYEVDASDLFNEILN